MRAGVEVSTSKGFSAAVIAISRVREADTMPRRHTGSWRWRRVTLCDVINGDVGLGVQEQHQLIDHRSVP
jgi:hypothetical protein